MEEWKRFASVINPDLKRPVRSSAELVEARKMNVMYSRQTMRWDKRKKHDETRKMWLRDLAIEELPAELRDKAREADETSIPDYFILTERVPAPENVDVFGQYQKPGQRLVVGDKGMPPVVPKIRHVRKLY